MGRGTDALCQVNPWNKGTNVAAEKWFHNTVGKPYRTSGSIQKVG